MSMLLCALSAIKIKVISACGCTINHLSIALAEIQSKSGGN